MNCVIIVHYSTCVRFFFFNLIEEILTLIVTLITVLMLNIRCC